VLLVNLKKCFLLTFKNISAAGRIDLVKTDSTGPGALVLRSFRTNGLKPSNLNEMQPMKSYSQYLIMVSLLLVTGVSFGQTSLDTFLADFDYESRKEMKVSSEQLVTLLQEDKAVLVDIRFAEEHAAWQMPYAVKMPLHDLPLQYSELPKDMLIVTACPHKDRAIIAMVYLKTKGYDVAYLKDGLLGLAEYLRGDQANDFIKKFNE